MKKLKFMSFLCGAMFSLSTAQGMVPISNSEPQNNQPNTINQTLPLNSVEQTLSISLQSPYTEQDITLYQGAVLNYSERDIQGTINSTAQIASGIANPYSVTSNGILALINRDDMPSFIDRISTSYNPYASINARHISTQFSSWRGGPVIPWILDINNNNTGLTSSVTLKLLPSEITNGMRDIYIRNLNKETRDSIRYSDILDTLVAVIGRPSEGLETAQEPILAIRDQNQTENTARMFASELTAYFLKSLGVIPNETNCSNVISSKLSSGAGIYDILGGKAGNDILFKRYGDVADTGGCCGLLLSIIRNFTHRR